MTRKPAKTASRRQRRLDAIVGLCRSLSRRPHPSWFERAAFGTTSLLSVGRTQVTVQYLVHVVPPGGREGVFRSSVTVWLKSRRQRSWRTGGWNKNLVNTGWYGAYQRLLARHGYRGKWRPSPWGRFGDFWKSINNGPSLVAEIATLESMQAEHLRLWGRRRTRA